MLQNSTTELHYWIKVQNYITDLPREKEPWDLQDVPEAHGNSGHLLGIPQGPARDPSQTTKTLISEQI